MCCGLRSSRNIGIDGFSFNNYTLKYVDASFYQIARGLVLPITVLLSPLFLASRPSLRVLISCAVVTAGFFIGVLLDNYSTSPVTAVPGQSSTHILASSIGIFFGLLSSVTTATSAVIIKRSLDVVNGNTLHLAWYNNLLSSIVLIPIIVLAGEGPEVRKLLFETAAGKDWTTFLWDTLLTVSAPLLEGRRLKSVFCAQGLFGFLICIAGFMSIKVTSPITHMVSSAVRGVVVTVFGVWFFHDVITTCACVPSSLCALADRSRWPAVAASPPSWLSWVDPCIILG